MLALLAVKTFHAKTQGKEKKRRNADNADGYDLAMINSDKHPHFDDLCEKIITNHNDHNNQRAFSPCEGGN